MGDDLVVKYAPLRCIVMECDRLVDIWNKHYSKGCECINSPHHHHLKELRTILLLFAEWKNCFESKYEFITNKSWEDLCWLVYSMEGIAREYLKINKSCRMRSDVCKFEFAAFRQSNSNGSENDIRGIEATRLSYRGHDVSSFSRIVKSNSRREVWVDIASLSAKLVQKRKRDN